MTTIKSRGILVQSANSATWFESKKKDHQYMYYEYWYRRKADDRRSIIFGRVYLPGAAANPVTGYAINAFTHDKIGEAYVY